MNYKLPTELKLMFIANVAVFITGIIINNDLVASTSVIIFVILSVSVQILDAIYESK